MLLYKVFLIKKGKKKEKKKQLQSFKKTGGAHHNFVVKLSVMDDTLGSAHVCQ